MEVDITYGNITVRLGNVLSTCGTMVQPETSAGVQVISYTYGVPGTAYQVVNPIPVNDNVAITSTVATGTWLQALDSLVVLFTRTTRPNNPENPPTFLPFTGVDEALAIVVVPYGPLTGLDSVLVRPPAIGNPNNATIATIRGAPLVFDNATIGTLPAIIDLDTLPTTWGTFGNERPDIDDFLDRFGGFCGELWKGYGTASWTPFLQHPGYGRTMATQTSQGLLLAISTEDAAKRRELSRRMTQWGVDLLGAFLSGRNDQVDGAHYQGRKALIVFSGHMLEAPWEDATTFCGATVFNEDEQFFTASPAWVWGWPYGYLGRTEFPTNLNAPIASWNGNVDFYLTGYFEHVCGAQMGAALAMDLLGLRTEMGVAHYGMMAQWMEGPSAPNLAAMAVRNPAFADIPWGKSYSTIGGRDFARAAWEAYSDYVPDVDPPADEPNIGVTGNGVAIANGDDEPSPTDHTLFGSTVVGGSTISRTFTVTNTGTKELTIASVTVPTGYTVTTALGSTIAVAGSDELILRLDAGSQGTKYGPVSIVSDDPDAPKFEFFVSGTVVATGGGSGGPSPLPAFPVPMIRLRNHSTSPFRGWVRTTTDAELAGPVHFGAHEIVPARRIGLDVHAVDVWVYLAPDEAKDIDLTQTHPSNWVPTPPPADPVEHFGGTPRLNGAPMEFVGYAQDGAAWRAHYAVRFGRMFLCDLWLRWYPDQPAIVEAECMVTCSNADVPDMGEVLPDFRLTWGDSWQFGATPKAGMRFADGQARAFPLTFVWQRHLKTSLDWSTAGCIVNHQIGAVGVSKLLPHGNPSLPADFNLPRWAAEHWERSQAILTTWEHPRLGPTANTANAGDQECQCFTGGEPFIEGGTGAEWIRYFAALAYSGHPCHHYEKDGTVVDRDRRPGVRMFSSRPHQTGTDRLGKSRDFADAGELNGETLGWNGPDAQHLWLNTLAGAARLKDSPAVQRMLECQGRNFLIQFTTTPGWSTSAIWSAREMGLVSMAALDLWRSLEDRGLAARVKAHFIEWVERIALPHIAKTGPIWRVEKDAPSVGPGEWWQLWQHALAAYGFDLAAEQLCTGDLQQRMRSAALACATLVLERGWVRQGDRLIEYEQQRVDGTAKTRGADNGVSFALVWMPLAPATVLRHDPTNALAREVWQQIVADANGNGKWLPPETLLVR